MVHVVNVSGGSGSALSLIRVVERYGKSAVKAVFADTKTEDPTLYTFLDDLEKLVGVPLERVAEGRTIWEVFKDTGMFTNPQTGGCLASYYLKKRVLRKWLSNNELLPETTTIHVGFDITEDDRMVKLVTAGKPWKFDFPLRWKPTLVRCDVERELVKRGLTVCSMYERGYGHANCGGTCVLAGIKQWAMVLSDYPERYAEAQQVEDEIMEDQQAKGRQVGSILTDRTGGVNTPLPLTKLKRHILIGMRSNGDSFREKACNCVGLLYGDETS